MTAGKTPRTIVGMSGGVDSSVAALLLRDQACTRAGDSIAGLFMDNWADDAQGRASVAGGRTPAATDAQGRASVAGGRTPGATDAEPGAMDATRAESSHCRAVEDRRDAVAVCGKLGIPIHFRDFSAQYWSEVFEHFIAEYAAGRTPNPDVACNREIKFKHFLDAARELGAQSIATGHYARIDHARGQLRLLRALDRSKDQSYFLHQLGQAQLAATRFPLGELAKTRVREIAREAGLATAAKKDSTGICFVGERNFREFLSRYLPARRGQMRTPKGQVVGEHPGVFYFTLGQREGLDIGGRRGFAPAPWYVIGKDVVNNVLYVDQGADTPWLMSQLTTTEAAHWVAGAAPATRFSCTAQTRYRQADEPCEVAVADDRSLQVRFARPQRAVTPGQSLVLYDGDTCLGGAVIATTDAPLESLIAARMARATDGACAAKHASA